MNNFDYTVHYSRFHDETDLHAAGMAAWQLNLIAPYAPDDRSINVLDIGCGFGFTLRALTKLGFSNIEGVEISPTQARVASKAGFNVHITDDTERFLRDRPAKYGFILLMDVLEHLPVPRQIDLLKALYFSLIPGGRVLLTVPNANAILAARWRYIDFTHFSSFTEHTMYFVLKNAGFDNLSISAEKGIGRFPRRIWTRENWPQIRKWIVRWCWLQVFKAEIPWERLDEISFELNLTAVATKA